MATNRKLGRTTDIRLAMLKTQVTDLLWHGKIETTVTRAKETKAIVDSLIAIAIINIKGEAITNPKIANNLSKINFVPAKILILIVIL